MTERSSVANENYFKTKKMVRCSSRASIGSHNSSVQSSRGDVVEICDEELDNEIQTKLNNYQVVEKASFITSSQN
jgi:hypothetical protein